MDDAISAFGHSHGPLRPDIEILSGPSKARQL